MKKIFILLFISLLSITAGYSQYFQGTFINSGNTLIFKMKPSANLTTAISYIEFSFRYITAGAPSFSIGSLVNSVAFPGINMQRRTDYVSGAYTYVRFVHNTSTITSFTYVGATEYEICRFNLIGPAAVEDFEMSSDLVDPSNETVFGVVDGGGNFIDPGSNDQLYGPGFYIAGNLQLVPLANVPIPVKFIGFSATKKDDNGLLNWQVENESAVTDIYMVERSFNGRDFTSIASLPKKNNGASANAYAYSDNNLKALRTDIIYYRIKQIDKDGKFAYTEIRSIRLDGKSFSASVFPNPIISTGSVNIDLAEDVKVSITLTDAAGKEVQKGFIDGKKGLNIYKLNMATFAAGTYQLKVIAGNENKVLPVVKSK
ncbi:MAG: T9SS type A sorting domain-containing protein [Ferruginibacter sp.]